MKKHIHPTYNNIKAICSCGNIINIHSTLTKPVSIDACNRCHPFYTGKQRVLDTAGRVERFNKRFNRS